MGLDWKSLPYGHFGDFALNPIKDSNQNVTIFSSGVGDGTYPSYWGIDRNGQTCELITDFLIINPLDEKST